VTLTGPRRPGADRLWGESWYFDFASVDATVGGFVRIGDYPNLGRRWCWAYVAVGSRVVGCALDRPLTDQHEPAWQTTDEALRLSIEPGRGGWQLTAAADGFALDLMWRERARPYAYTGGSRLEQPGWVRGELTVDGTRHELDGPGQRDHSWGIRDWWRFGWTWCAGALSDGTRFQATLLDARGRIPPDGYLMTPDGPPEPVHSVAVHENAVRLNDIELEFADVAQVTLELPPPPGRAGQPPTRLRRAMVRVRTATGQQGIGWRERNMPGATPD
jgi:hypothetical protein